MVLELLILILDLFLVGLFVNFDDFVVWIQSEWILILMITGLWICFFGAQRFFRN